MTNKQLQRVGLFGDQSFIELVDFAAMGNRGDNAGDLAVVDGARVSFGRQASEFSPEKNAELAGWLWDASDASPFYQFILQFRVRMPVHIALQWFMFPWAWYNEISGRYTREVSKLDHCFVPQDFEPELADLLRSDFEQAAGVYGQLYDWREFEKGEKPQVAKELARSSTLYTFSTEFIFTTSLRKLAHFLMFFADRPDFSEIREAFMYFIRWHAPVFAEKFKPYLQAAQGEKAAVRDNLEWSFGNDECWVLGDPHGAVKLLEKTGTDETLAQRARWLYGHEGDDYHLIQKLVRGSKRDDLHPALSAIGMEVALKVPVYIFRQMYRHQRPAWYGLTLHHDQFFVPTRWRAQTKGSRYDFADFGDADNARFTEILGDHVTAQQGRFQQLLTEGASVQQAERFLPYCFYVSVVRRGDAIDLFNMFNLRCDSHAQAEHRAYAMRMLGIFANMFPITFRVWKEEYWTGENPEVDQLYMNMTS